MQDMKPIEFVFQQVSKKCNFDLQAFDESNPAMFGRPDRIIRSQIIAACDEFGEYPVLLKRDGSETCPLTPYMLGYVDAYRLRLGIFDVLDWKLQHLSEWQGAGIFVHKKVADKAIKGAVSELTGIDPSKPGRPRTQEAALKAYNSLFPDGHNGKTWKEVLAEIKRDTDIIYSESSLKRGLGVKK